MFDEDNYEIWEQTGLLEPFKTDEVKKKNVAKMYSKMANYILTEEPNAQEFETAAFAIICRVMKDGGEWNGPFIPKEILQTYRNYYSSIVSSDDKVAEACKKTAEYYSMNKDENKPKNGGISSIR